MARFRRHPRVTVLMTLYGLFFLAVTGPVLGAKYTLSIAPPMLIFTAWRLVWAGVRVGALSPPQLRPDPGVDQSDKGESSRP